MKYKIALYSVYGSYPWCIESIDIEVTNATKIKDIVARRRVGANYLMFEFRKKSFLFDMHYKVRQLRTNLTITQLLKKITTV